MDDHHLEAIGAGSLDLCGAACRRSGIGLLLRKRWAEYFTVLITGSFIPFELYEIAQGGHSPSKLAVTLINVAIVVYLIICLRHPREPENR